MKYDGSSWILVGNAGLSADIVAGPSIALDRSGTPYVAYANPSTPYGATVMKFDTSIHAGVKNISTAPPTLTISPNPNHGSFTLSINEPFVSLSNCTITITNILGEKVKEFTTTTNQQTQVQLAAPPGMYFITATTATQTTTSKIVVQ